MMKCLSETACLSLGLEENENVALTHGSLDVADDGTAGIVHELHANLGDTTTRACAADDGLDSSKLGAGGVCVGHV